jgi:hypothetical protein
MATNGILKPDECRLGLALRVAWLALGQFAAPVGGAYRQRQSLPLAEIQPLIVCAAAWLQLASSALPIASTKKNSPHITDSSTPKFFLVW